MASHINDYSILKTYGLNGGLITSHCQSNLIYPFVSEQQGVVNVHSTNNNSSLEVHHGYAVQAHSLTVAFLLVGLLSCAMKEM